MAFDWGEKVLDLVLAALPGVGKLIPDVWRRRATARLQDFNPMAGIGANEDLLRALRLAWIEAALDVDRSAVAAALTIEWRGQQEAVHRFSGLLREPLLQLRHEAFDRQVHPGRSPIDLHLKAVLIEVPDYLRAAAGQQPGQKLTLQFVPILAELVGWPMAEIPSVYGHVASQGVSLEGAEAGRAFGELVFAAFGEIIKSKDRYPEAGVAFSVSLLGLAQEVATRTLQRVTGLDSKVDALIEAIRQMPNRQGLTDSLAQIDAVWQDRWHRLDERADRMERKLDASAEADARGHVETQAGLREVLLAVRALGQVGAGQNQVAHETVLSLAGTFISGEVLDFDSAVRTLKFAIAMALESKAQSQIPHGDQELDAVLQRVAATLEAGQLEQGAALLDSALDKNRQEAALLETKERSLREAAIRQAVMLHDAERVAKHVEALVALDHPVKPACSNRYQARLQAFHDEGVRLGVNFSLEVAIAMSKRRLAVADTPEARAEALRSLAYGSLGLGHRHPQTAWLEESLKWSKTALDETSRERFPADWARIQNRIGSTLFSLGVRESKNDRLRAAIDAQRAALEVFNPDHWPAEWAHTQCSLGHALRMLGARENTMTYLTEALAAYTAAISRQDPKVDPLGWARTKHHIGVLLQILGDRIDDIPTLEASLEAFQAAIDEPQMQAIPLECSQVRAGMGIVLASLGTRTPSIDRLKEAIATYGMALSGLDRKQVPLDWARAQHNLGAALTSLGARESGTSRLQEALNAYGAALEERTRERVPLDWARSQGGLADAYRTLGERENDPSLLRAAVAAYQASLKEGTRDRVPLEWMRIQQMLGTVLTSLGIRDEDIEALSAAVEALQAALEEAHRDRAPNQWAECHQQFGMALHLLGVTKSDPGIVTRAIESLRAALAERDRPKSPLNVLSILVCIAAGLAFLGTHHEDTDKLQEALAVSNEALALVSEEANPQMNGVLRSLIEDVSAALEERA